jgi:hypothetical protein
MLPLRTLSNCGWSSRLVLSKETSYWSGAAIADGVRARLSRDCNGGRTPRPEGRSRRLLRN